MLLLAWLACTADPGPRPSKADTAGDTAWAAEGCTGGDDEDGDGLVDCADPDCTAVCPEHCADGVDDDADGLVDCADPDCTCDADGDGHDAVALGGDDCDDTRADVHPGAPEVCGGRDDDCDGLVDDLDPDVVPDGTFWRDGDADGWGAEPAVAACAVPPGHADRDGDCDDTRADVNPDQPEVCSGVDDDCSGLADEDDPGLDPDSRPPWYRDVDGDGLGDGEVVWVVCDADEGWVLTGGDCDDDDPAIGAARAWRDDADGDGFGGGPPSDPTCVAPVDGWVDGPADCDDADPQIHPEAPEVACDGVDQDCDGADGPCAVDAVRLGRVTGDVAFGAAGTAIASGDLDDDGATDLVVGVPVDDRGGLVAGAAVVVPLRDGDLGLGPAPTRVDGTPGAEAGAAVAVHDLGGDGLADLIVGAPGAEDDITDPGVVAVLSGPVAGAWSVLEADGRIWGTRQRARAGTALVGTDVDGPALLIGAEGDTDDGIFVGRAVLFLGPVVGDLTLDDADTRFPGALPLHRMGSAVAAVDLDGDGAPAFVIGARGDATHDFDNGAIGIHRWPVLGTRLWADADARWRAVERLAGAGAAVAPADLDGGGPRVLVGAPGSGTVFVVDGAIDGEHLLPDVADRLVGPDDFGAALGVADVDGDGRDDVLVASPGTDADRGWVHLFPGPIVGTVAVPAWTVAGPDEDVDFGTAVAHAEGRWLVGAPQARDRLGAVYLLPGDIDP